MLWECIVHLVIFVEIYPQKMIHHLVHFVHEMNKAHQGMCFKMCKNWWPMTYNDFPTTSPQQLLSSENQTNTSHEVPPRFCTLKISHMTLNNSCENNKEFGWNAWQFCPMCTVPYPYQVCCGFLPAFWRTCSKASTRAAVTKSWRLQTPSNFMLRNGNPVNLYFTSM